MNNDNDVIDFDLSNWIYCTLHVTMNEGDIRLKEDER